MSNRASQRRKSNQINAACLLGALFLAGVFAPTLTQEACEPRIEQADLVVPESVAWETSRANLPSSYLGKRDPWANPILSCSLVSPSDFGYDRQNIYRLPSAPREVSSSRTNGLRDPMANLLLKNVDGGASAS